jgi:hypothetical protein
MFSTVDRAPRELCKITPHEVRGLGLYQAGVLFAESLKPHCHTNSNSDLLAVGFACPVSCRRGWPQVCKVCKD